MAYRHMRYPGGKIKAVTLSYDDGARPDIRLAEICNRHNIKCTFNITPAFMSNEEGVGNNLSAPEIQKYILDAGHEVALHGATHKAPGMASATEVVEDILTCRKTLEAMFGRIIRGMAYPDSGIMRDFVTPYETVKQILCDLGVVYARTACGDNDAFTLPNDWHAWMPTTHHDNPLALSYAENFVNMDLEHSFASNKYPRLFYLWGHSFEFVNNNNWEQIEALCSILGGHDDIWYATNIEIYDYVNAYRSLIFSADGTRVYNPTLYTIWFSVVHDVYKIEPGKTLIL